MQAAHGQPALSQWSEGDPAAERCRNCGCEHARRRFKRRDLCGKCFYLFECIRTIERWDRSKPDTLKNIGPLRRRLGGDATPLEKLSDPDFAAVRSAYLEQLQAALRGLRSREARRRGEMRVDGLVIEDKLKDLLKVVQLRDRYDRVAGRFSGVAGVLDHAFSPEQCRILYSLLDDIEEQSYGQVTEGHRAFEAVYQSRTPAAAEMPRPRSDVRAESPLAPIDGPNDLWLVDFRHRVRCAQGWLYPLLVVDAHMQAIVAHAICTGNGAEALKARLIEAFRARGLPRRIALRHGQSRAALSPLEVWLIEHDLHVDLAARNHAPTMAPFERLLRDLRVEVLDRAFPSVAAAEQALAQWRARTECRRVDCADGQTAKHAQPALRHYADEIAPFEYAPHDIVRRVQERGRVSLFGRVVRVPKSFRGKDVAFRPTAQAGVLDVMFRAQRITTIDVRPPVRRPVASHPGGVGGHAHVRSGGRTPDQLHAVS